jgi:hypothetical protein
MGLIIAVALILVLGLSAAPVFGWLIYPAMRGIGRVITALWAGAGS